VTPRGEVAVETLAIGDAVVTLTHGIRPIVWIGRRRYSAEQALAWPGARPILIEAGAIEDGVPHRDLLVSPEHALLVSGILVPAGLLVNGTSIRRTAPASVAYVHIELDVHAAVLAEGMPAESFADHGSRIGFDNGPPPGPLRSDDVTLRTCAPRVLRGARIDAVRRRIDARVQNEAGGPEGSGVRSALRLAT
jgi:hypothetical protein